MSISLGSKKYPEMFHMQFYAPGPFMLVLIKLFLISKLDLIRTFTFVKQLCKIQIQKGGKVLLWK